MEMKERSGQEKGRRYHFESVCLDAEVRVVFVALDHTGLDSPAPTLDEDLWAIHRQQLHLLHFSDSPEENLTRGWAELSLRDPGRSQRAGAGLGVEARGAPREPLWYVLEGAVQLPEGPVLSTMPHFHPTLPSDNAGAYGNAHCPTAPKNESVFPCTIPPLGIYSARAECWQELGRCG